MNSPNDPVTDRLRRALSDRYAVEREVGRGGMATVYRARDIKHDRAVAIKVLHPELAEAVGTERFLREVRITARLSHPHILPLLDSGDADGLLYYVMPFVDGESLRERIRREGELPVEDALRLVREAAEALGHAHAAGIVHRDIKPENILLQGGHALVADFGIARALDDPVRGLTSTGLAVGTPLYMSPEQAHGAAGIDGRSDIYSLAAVAWELLTGEPPWTGPNALAITARKMSEAVPSLRTRRTAVSAEVEMALTRALAPVPADRFRNTAEFAAALAHGSPATTRPPARPRSATPWLVASAVAVLGVAGWLLTRNPTPDASPAPALNSLAVLPFENLSPDSSQAYFAEGLADELVTSLSMVDGMRVAARTSTSALLRQGLDLQAIATKLDVQAVLEGSLRIAGDSVRVSTRLVRVADGASIWSQRYNRGATDVLRIQEEVATAIVEALRGRLVSGNAEAVRSGTTDPEAYDLYLQGRAQRLRQSEQALNRAVEFFRAAIARAPGFARAHALLAESQAVQGFYDFQPPREAFPAARDAATEALRLDPRNASAQATLAYVALYHEWDLPRAEDAFKKAIALDSNSAIAHQWYGNYLAVAQRWDEAEVELRTALRLEPTAAIRHAVLVWVQSMRGDHERALESFRSAALFDSTNATTFQWGAMSLEATGRLDEAVRALEWATTVSNQGAVFVAGLARALALRGERARAEGLLERLLAARVVPAYEVAKVYLALGDRARALQWLDRALAARAHSMVFLRIDPQLAPLRGDPALEALARKVGLAGTTAP
ncbi:MAG: protein kinase [Gemmatimonadetes bacterium]|nr:protein kinase [Gemmatimonadota bacterium]